mgnify:CR=1 FL=1
MIGSSVKRLPTLIPVAAILVGALLLAGCGVSSLKDSETATDAKAAEGAAAKAEATTEAAAETAQVEAVATTAEETAPAADNSGTWSTIENGAQTFAAQLDQANQSVASCQTDAAAGADFDTCIGKAYTTIAAAASTLAGTVDELIADSDGQCRDALSTLRDATQAMASDYTSAADTTDLTSRQTLEARIGDDAQAYADDALAAAAACVG